MRERTLGVLDRRGAGDGTLLELVVRHELQHTETMRQALELGGLDGYEPVDPAPLPGDPLDLVPIPGGLWRIGAAPEGFAYDNERPRHVVDVAAFRIARRPVTNGSWLSFTEGGGYERREWWSDEGWAWKEEYDITHRGGARRRRSVGARLPRLLVRGRRLRQEPRGPPPDRARVGEGGDLGPADAAGAGGDDRAASGSGPRASSPATRGSRRTRTRSTPRCSSTAATGCSGAARGRRRPRVVTPTFRNWDLPQRRQIFAGLRLAMDG